MPMGPNERRLKEETTKQAARAKTDADLDSARTKTACLREERLDQEAKQKTAAASLPKVKKAPRSRKSIKGGE